MLAVLLAVAGWLFPQEIEPAEMAYALIARRARAQPALFEPSPLPDYRRWRGSDGAVAATAPAVATRPGGPNAGDDGPARGAARRALARAVLVGECESFLARWGDHDRAAEVDWVRVAAMEAGARPLAVGAGPSEAAVHYRGRPAEDSAVAATVPATAPAAADSPAELYRRIVRGWQDLAERSGGRLPGQVATARLGVEALRDGRFQKAREHLTAAREALAARLGRRSGEDREPVAEGPLQRSAKDLRRRIFRTPPSLPGRAYGRAVLDDVEHLLWLMDANEVARADSRTRHAFAEYMKSWPMTRPDPAELKALAAGYQGTALADNFRLLLSLTEPDPLTRAARLKPMAGTLSDAAIVANYELGRLAIALDDLPAWRQAGLRGAAEYFQVVVSAPENPYQGPAARHLAWLEHRGRREGP
jgi:hypothetical protein